MTTSKETPILFKPEMIWAILSGQKTQTRRLIKPQPKEIGAVRFTEMERGYFYFTSNSGKIGIFTPVAIKCPYGRKGDLLWVREAIRTQPSDGMRYKSDGEWLYPKTEDERRWVWKKRICSTISPIFMPKWACRLWLELTADPTPQRLQEITEEDVLHEGFKMNNTAIFKYGYKGAFTLLWESINGPNTWEKNPWVWKLKFKRVEP